MRGTVSERVVREVSRATASDTLGLSPPYDAIEPDALDTVVEDMADDTTSFDYAGHEVTVGSDRSVSHTEYPTGTSVGETIVGEN